MNQLGFLRDDLKYVPILNSSFVERKVYTLHKGRRRTGKVTFLLKLYGWQSYLLNLQL